tara:strand:+ start:9617 stop:10138 length:522 start_codon:yes stop_codon:yes gene_type:complete
MDQETWKRSEDLIYEIEESLDKLLDSPELEELRSKVAELGKRLGERYSVGLNCIVDIMDWEKDQSLQLLNTGISTNDTGDTGRTWNSATFQRYVVNGEIQIVPHDHCPSCWGDWLFKTENTICPECGIVMGKECKILLDSDECPHCEKGKLSMSDAQCDQCGFSIDPRFVVWG